MSRKLKDILEEDGYLAYRLQTNDTTAPSELFCIEEKLRGIGFLFEANDADVVADDGDLRAVGRILKELAAELQQIRNFVEPRLSENWKGGDDA